MKCSDTKNLINGLNQRIKSLENKVNQLDKALCESYFYCPQCQNFEQYKDAIKTDEGELICYNCKKLIEDKL